jgi:hypothetical protein
MYILSVKSNGAIIFLFISQSVEPVTVVEQPKACTIFDRSEAGTVCSNPTQDMNVLYVYAFILCLCCSVFR